MIRKEWLDQRLKLTVGLIIGLATLLIGVVVAPELGGLPNPDLQTALAEMRNDSSKVLWGTLFQPGNSLGLLLLVLAATVGTSLIAGEVARSTIFVLLARPLSRRRLLLTKYAVGAAGLLVLILSLALVLMAAATGHAQHLGGVLLSALLTWLGSLFVLGLATLFSVMFSNVLLPLLLSLAVTALLALLPLLGLPVAWSLPSYWSSFPVFLGQQLPLREILVSLIAAAAPLLLAVRLFRRWQY
jgi:ABC-2 type transport system permease protein